MGAVGLSGLLLRDAVNAPATREERSGVDQLDRSARIRPLKDFLGDRVTRVIEPAQNDGVVAHIVIDVLIVDETLVVAQCFGSWHRDEVEPLRLEQVAHLL